MNSGSLDSESLTCRQMNNLPSSYPLCSSVRSCLLDLLDTFQTHPTPLHPLSYLSGPSYHILSSWNPWRTTWSHHCPPQWISITLDQSEMLGHQTLPTKDPFPLTMLICTLALWPPAPPLSLCAYYSLHLQNPSPHHSMPKFTTHPSEQNSRLLSQGSLPHLPDHTGQILLWVSETLNVYLLNEE